MSEQPETTAITRRVETEMTDDITAQLSYDQFEAIVEETLDVLVERHPELSEEGIISHTTEPEDDEESGGLESDDSNMGLESNTSGSEDKEDDDSRL